MPRTLVVFFRVLDGQVPVLDWLVTLPDGNVAAVVSHGIEKERAVPPIEIDRAIERRRRFIAKPAAHTFVQE